MKLRNILMTSVTLLFATQSFAWNLVYSHDANGTGTFGSLQALRTAVNNGASVKVLVVPPSVHTWQVSCSEVSVRTDTSQSVACIANSMLSFDLTAGAQFGAVPSPNYSQHFAMNTLGQYAQANVQNGSGTLLSRSTQNFAMQWYVD